MVYKLPLWWEGIRGREWRTTALVLGMVLTAWVATYVWLTGLYADYRDAQIRSQSAVIASSGANLLANAVQQRLALVRGLAAFVTTKVEENPHGLEREFPAFAASLFSQVAGIRNISAAPDFIVRHVYPRDLGNLKVIGNNLLDDRRPGFADAVRRAVATRDLVVHEPVRLIQGDLGLIARHGVFVGDRPWGAVAVVFNISSLLDHAGLSNLPSDYRWAVRTLGQQVIGGDAEIFQQEPALARADLPEGYWEVAVVPKDGWLAARRQGIEPMLVHSALGLLGLIATLWALDMLLRQRRLERLVHQRTHEWEVANQELEKFAYASAHDLQEPLRGILISSQKVSHILGEDLPEEARLWMNELATYARRMKNQMHDVQSYLGEVHIPLPSRPCDASYVLQMVLKAHSAQVERVGAKLNHDALPTVMADKQRLTEIFHALIQNALTFHHPARRAEIRITGQVHGTMAEIRVQDNGLGIDPAFHERIFTVFQRLHDRSTYPGNGMGLALARKMAERLGGSLSVESVPDHGSTFVLRLPTGAA